MLDDHAVRATGALAAASARASAVSSFKAMDVLQAARAIEASGERVLHLELGEPNGGAPRAAIAAAKAALDGPPSGLGYTPARGLLELRRAISAHYGALFGASVPEGRVHVTSGASAALVLGCAAAFDAGDAVALARTTYPCYRNVLAALGCEVVPLLGGAHPFRDGAAELRATAEDRRARGLSPLRGAILASPANPTGTAYTPAEMVELCATARALGLRLISDETYLGLSYAPAVDVSAAMGQPDGGGAGGALIVGSFSKYHAMTGWRVGWLIAPPELDGAVERLQQNLNICAPAISQRAALAALTSADAAAELDARAAAYARSRGVVLGALARIGVAGACIAPADGAFYVYADVHDALRARARRLGGSDRAGAPPLDAEALCAALLADARVALTPGSDFEAPGAAEGLRRVRLSYAAAPAEIAEAMARIEAWWERGAPQPARP